jgi:3-oxoadipate enol-lactonase
VGEGRPIVFLHSLLADRTSFDLVAPLLAARHQLVMLDLPGFGGSEAAEGGLDAVADRVAAAIAALGFTEPPVLLGNGYGGFVALDAVIRHPGIACRAVFADCGACFTEPGRAAFRFMAAKARDGGLAAIADIAMTRLFAPEYQASHPDLIAERRRRFLTLDPAVFDAACEALATLDLRPSLASVTAPVLVVVGEFDQATPPPMSRELAALLPNADLAVIPGCAHVPQLQEPEVFLSTIRDFIAGQ